MESESLLNMEFLTKRLKNKRGSMPDRVQIQKVNHRANSISPWDQEYNMV